jgi:hypothetical protein
MLRALHDLFMRAKLPRIGAHAAAAAQDATTALSPLPLSVVLHIFSLLPVDCRLRCAEVCRGWRSVLSERSLWTRLDLSATSGVRMPRLNYYDFLTALLRCAMARAGGTLQSFKIDGHGVLPRLLLEVAAANAGALHELHACNVNQLGFTPAEVEALLRAAPLLRVLATDVNCEFYDVQATRRGLRNEAPFEALRMRQLFVNVTELDEDSFISFAAELAAHASLRGLLLARAPLNVAAALDAVVDAALARRWQRVELHECRLSPASAPALARLLGSDALTTLVLWGMDLLDAPAARVLAAALRVNSTLTSLTLDQAAVFRDAAAVGELLSALTGHASLRKLSLRGNDTTAAADLAAVGASLGALVAANAPALTELDVSFCNLRDDGLRALFHALPHNTHLRTLGCNSNNISEAFARDVLLPAARANTSLRDLEVSTEDGASARVAAALVQQRPLPVTGRV